MLTIKCAKCKAKLLKYKKIGKGKILKCWESKIRRIYGEIQDDKLFCEDCGNSIGEVKTKRGKNFIDMKQNQFTYSGRKISK